MQHAKWDPEATAAFWINRASRLLLRLHESRLRPLGFGMQQLPALFALEARGPLTQRALTQEARVEQPSMAEMLGRLERAGMIARSPHPEDRRSSSIALTRTARTRLPKAKAELVRGEADAMAGFSAEEKKLLRALLQRVVENLEAESDTTAGG